MRSANCPLRQALADSIQAAVDQGDGPRLALLLDLLERVADAELLDRVEAAVTAPRPVPRQHHRGHPSPNSPCQYTREGAPKRT